jgi:hypothetical protein
MGLRIGSEVVVAGLEILSQYLHRESESDKTSANIVVIRTKLEPGTFKALPLRRNFQ